jgi:formylmethanofuran dehydrogenase subunit E
MTTARNAILAAFATAEARLKVAFAAETAACAPDAEGTGTAAACNAASAIVNADGKSILSIAAAAKAAAGLYSQAAPLGSMAKKSVNHNKLRPWALEFTTWLNGEAKDEKIIQTEVNAVRG